MQKKIIVEDFSLKTNYLSGLNDNDNGFVHVVTLKLLPVKIQCAGALLRTSHKVRIHEISFFFSKCNNKISTIQLRCVKAGYNVKAFYYIFLSRSIVRSFVRWLSVYFRNVIHHKNKMWNIYNVFVLLISGIRNEFQTKKKYPKSQ